MPQANNIAMMPEPEIVTASNGAEYNLSERLKAKRDAEAALARAIADGMQAEIEKERGAVVAQVRIDAPIIMAAKALFEGEMTKEQVSNLYGQAYGFKVKENGEQSKTPEGKGGSYRKRAVLLSEAAKIGADETFAENDWPTWAKGVDRAAIAEIVTKAFNNETSASYAYKELGSLKEKPKPKPLHMDAKKLADIVAALNNPEQVTAMRESAAIREAFDTIAALWLA